MLKINRPMIEIKLHHVEIWLHSVRTCFHLHLCRHTHKIAFIRTYTTIVHASNLISGHRCFFLSLSLSPSLSNSASIFCSLQLSAHNSHLGLIFFSSIDAGMHKTQFEVQLVFHIKIFMCATQFTNFRSYLYKVTMSLYVRDNQI